MRKHHWPNCYEYVMMCEKKDFFYKKMVELRPFCSIWPKFYADSSGTMWPVILQNCDIFFAMNLKCPLVSGVASAISEGDIFIYSCSAQLISFEVDTISKEINGAEHEYMNMSPSLIALVTPLPLVMILIQQKTLFLCPSICT